MQSTQWLQDEVRHKLARLRKQAGLTTRALSAITGLSQSRISRLENGRSVPSRPDVITILHGLNANDAVIESIVADVDAAADNRSTRIRSSIPRSSHKRFTQGMLMEMELDSTNVSGATSDLIPGWLQSPEYIQAVHATGWFSCEPLQDFVSARLKRQAETYAKRRQYTALLRYEVLTHPILPAPRWLALLDDIKERMRLGSMIVGIYPPNSGLPVAPDIGCIADDAFALLEAGQTTIPQVGRQEIESANRLFADLCEHAVFESEANRLIDEAKRQLKTVDLRSAVVHHV